MTEADILSNFYLYFKNSYDSLNWRTFILDAEFYYLFIKCHICWWVLYGIVHFFIPVRLQRKKDIYDTKTRIISIVHASLVFWLSLYDVMFNQSNKCGQTNSSFQNHLMIISASYFLYDLVACILLGCSDNEMVIHHFFCMLGYFTGLAYQNSANEMLRALIVTEVTCPIMHLRMILKNYNLKHTKLHVLLDFVYMFVYLIARCVYGTKVVIFTVVCWDNLILVKLAGIFIWAQSILFSKRMVHLLRHRYREFSERKRNNIGLFWFSHNKKVEDLDYYKKALMKQGYIP